MNGYELLNDIKIAALEAVAASCPCEIKYGVVTSVKPLLVKLDQKITLTENMLILPRRLTEHKIRISGNNVKDFYFLSDENSASAPVTPPHTHAMGDMEITFHGELKAGDKLILIRQQGGQKFLVFDLFCGEGFL